MASHRLSRRARKRLDDEFRPYVDVAKLTAMSETPDPDRPDERPLTEQVRAWMRQPALPGTHEFPLKAKDWLALPPDLRRELTPMVNLRTASHEEMLLEYARLRQLLVHKILELLDKR